MEIFTDDWVDVKKMHSNYPDTFDIPTQDELDNIKINDSVKISNGFERFWAQIIQVNTLYLLGKVDNELITNEYKLGDIIMFERHNIYDIHTIEYKYNIQNKALLTNNYYLLYINVHYQMLYLISSLIYLKIMIYYILNHLCL